MQSLYEQTMNQLMGGAQPQMPAAPRPEPVIPTLGPEEENSALNRLGGSLLSGLGYLGGSLDKAFGGRALRGLLGGKPQELASIIPFSDTMGITNPENIVHGSDLLGGNKDTPFLSPEGIGGLALDIGLDPATYLTLGGSALSKAGQIAKRAGALPKTFAGRIGGSLGALTTTKDIGQLGKVAKVAEEVGSTARAMGVPLTEDLLKQPLGGLAGVGLPFSSPSAILGTGPVGQKIGGLIDTGIDKLKYSGPVRPLAALFDPNVQGATTEAGQRTARAASETFKAGAVKASQKQLDALKILQDNEALGHGNLLRQAIEETPANQLLHGPFQPGIEEGIRGAAQRMRGNLDDVLRIEQELGLPSGSLVDSKINYGPRYMTTMEKDTPGYSSGARQALGTGNPSMLERQDIFRDIPGGTSSINAMSTDQELKALIGSKGAKLEGTAPNMLGPQDLIRNKYLGWDEATDAERLKLLEQFKGTDTEALRKTLWERHVGPLGEKNPLNPDELNQLTGIDRLGTLQQQMQQSEGLTGWVKSLDPQRAENNLALFGNDPTSDYLRRLMMHERSVANTGATYDLLAGNAKLAGDAEAGAVPLREVLKSVGVDAGTIGGKVDEQMMKRLVSSGHTDPNVLNQLYVPQKIAEDAARFTKAASSPSGLEPFLKVYDAVTNLTKASQTAIWPAFHTRNFVSGLWMNWVTGAGDPRYGKLNPMSYLKPLQDMQSLRTGGVVSEANKISGLTHLGEEQASKTLAEEMFARKVTGVHSPFADVAGEGEHLAQQQVPRLPGDKSPGLLEELKGIGSAYLPKSLEEANPLNIRGVGSNLGDLGLSGTNVTKFAPAKAGEQAGQLIEDLNRGSAYIAFRRQGYTPDMAAAQVKAAHFEYTASMTPFEKGFVRRMIPFYGWAKGNMPFTLQQLATKPGGEVATAIKATAEARGRNSEFLPPYLGQGLALPLGESAPGQQRFLSSTGLPFEDFTQQLSPTGALGSLNPLLKMPAELATGKQFFSGRDLADLHSMTGNTAADQLVANSPLSRLSTTGRTLFDERKDIGAKGLNLLTGARLTDVDLEKAKGLVVRDAIQNQLRGQPGISHFENLSVRPENLGFLSPHEWELLRLNATRERAARQLAAQRQP